MFKFKSGPKKGLWAAEIVLPNGKSRRLTRKTYAEARQAQRELEAQNATAAPEQYQTGSFGAWLDQWLLTKTELDPSTLDGYAEMVRLHIKPALGETALSKLDLPMLQGLVSAKDLVLSASRVRQLRAVLSGALEYAVGSGRISQNLAKLLHSKKVKQKKLEPYDAQEARELLETLRGKEWEALINLILRLGLRRGEALGLRWDDIDFETGRVTVRHNLRVCSKGLYVKEPKSGEPRVVALSDDLAQLLIEHRRRQAAARLKAGPAWQMDPQFGQLVFTTETGGPLSPIFVSKLFPELARAAQVTRKRLHDLRHTFVTLARKAGTDLATIQAAVGHSDIRTTMSIYNFIDQDDQQKLASSLDTLLACNN